MAPWLQVAPKVLYRLWNQILNKCYYQRVVRSRPLKIDPAQDRYLILSAWRHRQTMATELCRCCVWNKILQANSMQMPNREDPLRPAFSGVSPSEHITQESPFVVEPQKTILGHTKIGCEFFSLISRDSAHRVLLDGSSSRIWAWSRYHPSNISEIDTIDGRGIIVCGA